MKGPNENSGWECEPINLTTLYGNYYCTNNADTMPGDMKANCCNSPSDNKHDINYLDEANWGYDCCKCVKSSNGEITYTPVSEDGLYSFSEVCGGIAYGKSP